MDKPKLLSDTEVADIRAGVREGIRGPVMLKWVEQLLADRDERIRLGGQLDGTAPKGGPR